MSLAISVFNPEVENIVEFLERLKVQAADLFTSAGEDGLKKASILVKTLPVTIITDLQRRLKPKKLSEAVFSELEEILTNSYETKKSVIGATVAFLNYKQKPNESIENFARTLNNLCSECKYANCCRDRSLRDAFVSGLRSSKILAGLIQDCEDRTFNECVEKAKMLEAFSADTQDINPRDHSNDMASYKVTTPATGFARVPSDYVCIRCTAKGKHLVKNCFALQMTCNYCKKKGHIRKACKSIPASHATVVTEAPVISSLGPQLYQESYQESASSGNSAANLSLNQARNSSSNLDGNSYFNPFF